MSEELSDLLARHFERYEQAMATQAERARALEAESKQFCAEFLKIAQAVIEPQFAKARDLLISRKFAATVAHKPPRGTVPTPEAYIGLHCSTDSRHPRNDTEPGFYLGFAAHSGTIQVKSTNSAVPKFVKMVDLTPDNVTKVILEFIQTSFPIGRSG